MSNPNDQPNPVPIKHKPVEAEAYVADWEPASSADVELDKDVQSVDTRRYTGAFSRPDRPSPYECSPLCGSVVEQHAQANPLRLHNARSPHVAVIHEKPEHRVILFLKAEGHSNVEIAKITGYSAVMVSNIVRQPWAQDRIVQIIHESGGDAVRQLLVSEAVASVQRLVTERDNDNARPAERINAADKILDRLYGKPNQPIEHRGENLSEMSDEDLARIASTSGTATAPAA